MAYAKGNAELIKRYYRRVAATLLKTADILLTKSRKLRKLLLRQALTLPDPPDVLSDQSAHIHAQRSADYIL
jgi:hypothetical protein